MSAPLKKTFSWLWMVALLTATIGVSVQQMYCYCLNKTTSARVILQASTVPDQQAEPSTCCKKATSVQHPCCKKDGLSAKKKKGCSKKTTQVFQLKTEYVVDDLVVKSFDFPLWINDFPLLRRMARPVICDASIFHQALPPPPITGRDLCLRHQLYRC